MNNRRTHWFLKNTPESLNHLSPIRLYPLGCAVDVYTEHSALADTARELWPEEGLFDTHPLEFLTEQCAAEPQPLEFVARTDRFIFRAGSDVEGTFRRDARRGVIVTTSESAALLLESVILTALTWTHLLPIHAGCVSRDGRSLLLCGDSHAGKSTLAYAFAKSGWTYVSDNSLYWEPRADRLVSGSPTIKLRGRERRVEPVAEGIPSARTTSLGPIVFLQRRPGPALLHRWHEKDALRYFLSYNTRPDREAVAREYRPLMRQGVWRVEYEEAEDAVRCLEQLA